MGHLEQSNMLSTLDFCSRLTRKETNVSIEKLRAYCHNTYTVFSTELQIGSCFWFCLHIARWCPHLGVPLGTMRWQVTLTNHPDQRSLPHTNQTPQDQVWARCTVMCFGNFPSVGSLSVKMKIHYWSQIMFHCSITQMQYW